MKFRTLVSTSLRPLYAHRLRTVLTLTGVAGGVAAVLVSSAIGDGARIEVTRSLGALGTNLLIVKPLPVRRLAARRQAGGLATTFTPEDAAAVAALQHVGAVAPSCEGKMRVKSGAVTVNTTVRGSTTDYVRLRRYELASGRLHTQSEEARFERVAVLGAATARQLFPVSSPLGRELRLRGVPFVIIGVLNEKGAALDSADQDNQVLIPLGTALRRLFNVRWLTTAYVGVTGPEHMTGVESSIADLLRKRHCLHINSGPDDFAVQNTAKTRAVQQELTASLSRYATGLGAVALLVGGTGVLALMSLSVRERRGEIGLRMALGAQPADILRQFLTEAVFLSMSGWAAGCVLGGLATVAVRVFAGWTIGIPASGGLWTLAASIAVGLGFGALPALRAARMPPIVALVRQ